jgi:hypothetical protein
MFGASRPGGALPGVARQGRRGEGWLGAAGPGWDGRCNAGPFRRTSSADRLFSRLVGGNPWPEQSLETQALSRILGNTYETPSLLSVISNLTSDPLRDNTYCV